MPNKTLQELLLELDETLRSGGTIERDDRVLLEQLQVDLQAVLGRDAAPEPQPLRARLSDAVVKLQREHPRLATLLASTLDALSDLGV